MKNNVMDLTELSQIERLEAPNGTFNKNKNEINSPSLIGYFRTLLLDSMLTGVPQILSAGSLFRKVFKSIILISCIVGFIYQTVQFMTLYQTYPSSLEIHKRYTRDHPKPSITICNVNGVKRTKFCKEEPFSCAAPSNVSKFCEKYPTYCAKNAVTNDTQFLTSEIVTMKRDYVLAYGQDVKDLIHSFCLENDKIDTNQCLESAKTLVHVNEFALNRKCYSIDFAKISDMKFENESNDCLIFRWAPISTEIGMTLLLNLQPEEYSRPDLKPAAQIAIHSSDSYDNPFIKGFTAEMGKRYIVKLYVYEEKLLPAPYATNCVPKFPKDYNKEKCFLDCYSKMIKEKCACTPFSLTVSEETKLCEKSDCWNSVDTKVCEDQCPRGCYTFYFKYEVTENDRTSGIPPIDLGDGPVNNPHLPLLTPESKFDISKGTVINIIYAKNEITTYIFKPQYDKIEILGYIGGYIGIWLGFSLVAIFDFFETIVLFICFLFNKSKRKPITK